MSSAKPNLQTFVSGQGRSEHRNSARTPDFAQPPTGQLAQGTRPDRIGAQGLKFPQLTRNPTRTSTVSSGRISRPLSGTAPAPVYNSNRDTFPNHPFPHQTEDYEPFGGGLNDTTVTSHWDDTKSDVQVNGDPDSMGMFNRDRHEDEQYDDGDEDGEYDVHSEGRLRENDQFNDQAYRQTQRHILQHKQSKSPIITKEPQQAANNEQPMASISGRFHGAAIPQRQQAVADRSGKVPGQPAIDSKKRGRSREPVYEDEDHKMYSQQHGLAEDDLEETQFPARRKSGNGGRLQQEDGANESDFNSDGLESNNSPSRQQRPQGSHTQTELSRLEAEARMKPDYDDDELKGMTYADLKRESWETETHGKKNKDIDNMPKDPEVTLESRLENIANLDLEDKKSKEVQFEFFSQMSRAEWEQSGDLLMEKFGGLMKQIRHARKKKWDLVSSFEDEIEARENAVQGQSADLDKKLKDMRSGGESVLRGKIN